MNLAAIEQLLRDTETEGYPEDFVRLVAAVEAAERDRCAAWVDARRDAFCADFGTVDPSTGTLEFGRGALAGAREDYVSDLIEIADGLRALGPNLP